MEATEMTNTLYVECHDGVVKIKGVEVSEDVQEDSQDAKVQKTEEGEEVTNSLPEELVEKIFSMVPFPAVFKTRVLSKSWLARLSSISSQQDEKEKSLAISFQNRVREHSTNWKTYCPVSANEHGFIACDLPNQTLLNMTRPSLSFLPGNLRECAYQSHYDALNNGGLLAIEGALFLKAYQNELFVANFLTRRWKQLPTLTCEGLCARLSSLKGWSARGTTLLSYSSDTYMVIVIPYPQEVDDNYVHIYDSTSAAWSRMRIAPSLDFFDPDANQGHVAYLDGVLYFITLDEDVEFSATPCLTVLALGVQEGNSAVDVSGKEIRAMYTLICNSNLLVIILYTYDNKQNLVVKIDLRTRQVLGLGPGPPDEEVELDTPVSDGNYIFLRSQKDNCHHRLLAYDLHNDRWETLPCPSMFDEDISCPSTHGGLWIPLSFRPGMNPFVTV